MLQSVGWDIEETKQKANKLNNIVLGAMTDLTKANRGVATCGPDETKMKRLIRKMKELRREDKCYASEASNIIGKTRWMTSQLRGRAGTATMQPFQQRANGETDDKWTDEMSHSLEFLEIVTDPEFLPILEIDLLEGIDKASGGQLDNVIVYSDASYHKVTDPNTGVEQHVCKVSVNIYDQRDGRHYECHGEIPAEFYDLFGGRWDVNKGEALAVILVMYAQPKLLQGRRVIHFVDSAVALSHLINGYANKPDSARLVNMFHLALIALDIEWYGEWVPSKANVADLLTRPERGMDELKTVIDEPITNIPFELPPVELPWTSLREWAREMRRRGQ